MARTNESNLKIRDLFSNKVFRIPMYQRGYAWGDKQLKELWDDIMDIEPDQGGNYHRHYTGMIALKEIPLIEIPPEEKWLEDRGFSFYDVVDGQQRLTTLVILLYVLAKSYETIDPSIKTDLLNSYICSNNLTYKTYYFSYKTADNNNLFLINKIFDDAKVVSTGDLNVYTKNLLFAKKFFQERINELNPDARKILLDKLQKSLAFDTKYIDDELSVQAVFETMNNRGKPLTILEKLKNRLLFLTNKLKNNQGEIAALSMNINNAWGKIYQYLGKNPDSVLNEDEFLSAHLSLIRKPADYAFSETIAEQKVFEMFCNRANNYLLHYTRGQGDDAPHEDPVDYEKINTYVISISNYVKYWYDVVNQKSDSTISKILFLNPSKEMRIFLAELLSHKETENDEVKKCIELVYNVVFRDSIPGLSVLDERTFATRAREIHNNELSLVELNNRLFIDLSTPCNKEAVINEFRRLYTYQRGNKGFHRWSNLKFFLMEYEQHLKEKYYPKDLPHILWENFYEINIEHILPQNYSKNWNTEMEDYTNGRGLSPDNKEKASIILINTLGNLTIIRDKKNSSLQDDSWSEKRKRYKSGSFSEIEISSKKEGEDFEHVSWNKDTIYERGCDLVKFMESKIKGLKFDDEETKNLLFDREIFFPDYQDTSGDGTSSSEE